jgi:beta-lactamase superfamily II metal-dependent hydrolase
LLAIHILNVGHGDSTIVEYAPENEKRVFGLIDTNLTDDESPLALRQLIGLGATELSFLCITHAHTDHYSGVTKIIDHFKGKIKKLYTFPIEQTKLKKVAQLVADRKDKTDNKSAMRSMLEFLELLKFGKSMGDDWHVDTTAGHRVVPPGFEGIIMHQLLPPGRVRGKFIQDLEKGILNFEAPNQNDLSLAFLLSYKGHQFLLGGDGTRDNWLFQNRQWERMGINPASVGAKLPHHASRHDSSPAVLDIIFEKDSALERVACISANGRTHPSDEVLNDLISRGIKPYCTNLAVRCGAARAEKLESATSDPELLRYLSMFAKAGAGKKVQPCQGNITLRVSDEGELTIETEHNHPCPFRGDYNKLFSSVRQ